MSNRRAKIVRLFLPQLILLFLAMVGSAKPVADLTWTPLTPRAGETIQFRDASTGQPTRWLWEFEDNGSSTQQNPTHSFTRSRTFTITLTAFNATGSSRTFKTITVAPAPGAPLPNFTWTPGDPRVGDEVQFQDTSQGGPTQWGWTFDDNGFNTARNPRHTFSRGGSFGVTLTATNASGTSSATRMVAVTGAPGSPTPAFEWTPPTPKAGEEVQFTDRSTGHTALVWSFGDGDSSNAMNPKHDYDASGDHVVKLRASNSSGSNFATRILTVVADTGASHSLSVTKVGSGTVTSQPPGIACGSSCGASFTSGTSVTLTAMAAAGSTFRGWSGACAGTGVCTLLMTQPRAVTATFDTGTPLRIQAIEITQSNQDLANSMRLIEMRPTVAIVHYSGGNSHTPTPVTLTVRHDGIPQTPIPGSLAARPGAWHRATGPSTALDLGRPAAGHYTVDISSVVPLQCASGASCTRVEFTVQDATALPIVLIPVTTTNGAAGDDDMKAAKAELRAVFPIVFAFVQSSVPVVFKTSRWCRLGRDNGTIDLPDTDCEFADLVQSLGARRAREGSDNLYLGVVRGGVVPGSTRKVIGKAGAKYLFLPPSCNPKSDGTVAGFVGERLNLSHEVGHALGLPHISTTLCSGTPSSTCTFPNPGGKIAFALTEEGIWGLDTRNRQLLQPDVFADFMSYACDKWQSDVHYNQLFGVSAISGASSRSYTPRSTVLASGSTYLVRGIVDRSRNAGEIHALIRASSDVPAGASGDEVIARALDVDGQLVSTGEAGLAVDADGSEIGSFEIELELPSEVRRVEIVRQGVVLDTMPVTGREPLLSVIAPLGTVTVAGAMTVRWSATDPDGDALSYSLLFSADGGATWTTIVEHIGATEAVVPAAALTKTSNGRLRILASDGVRVASTVADAVIVVPQHALSLEIVTPRLRQTYDAGQSVFFDVNVSPSEATDVTVVWSSDRDGVLGRSPQLVVETAELTPGVHAMTVRATGADGSSAEATTEVRIRGASSRTRSVRH